MIADASIAKPTYIRSGDLLESNGIDKFSLGNLIKLIVGLTTTAATNFKAVSHITREPLALSPNAPIIGDDMRSTEESSPLAG